MTEQAGLEGFELSPQQRRLWARLRHESDGAPDAVYATSCEVTIRGPLDTERLAEALRSLSHKHEILRTEFHELEEMSFPVQVVREEPRLELRFGGEEGVDADGEDGEASLRLVAGLRRLDDSTHRLRLTAPALWCDGAGLTALVRELGRLYETSRDGSDDPEPLQYPDAATWLNDMLQAEETEPGREFWRGADRGPGPRARLPFERTREERGVFRPERAEIELSQELEADVARLVERTETSPACFWLTCWQAVLFRASRGSRMLSSAGHDGRGYDELESAVGLFRRYLPLAGEIAASDAFDSALSRVHEEVQAVRQWAECFDGGAEPLITDGRDVLPRFAFDARDEAPAFDSGSARWSITDVVERVDRFDLRLTYLAGPGPRLSLDFDASAYDRDDVERLARWLLTLATDAVSRPEQPLGRLALATETENEERIAAYRSRRERPPETCFHELFEARVGEHPERPAAFSSERTLTYLELNRHANRLAAELVRNGVGPDVPVGLSVGRSADMLVGVLGIQKAGGAYVPLDPTLPEARLRAMIDRARAPVVVVPATGDDSLAADGVEVVRLDDSEAGSEHDVAPEVAVEAEHLAYVLFTSGSTGVPKGVGVEHRQLVSYVRAAHEGYDWVDGASAALVSTFSADLGHTAIFPTLAAGGAVHILSEDRIASPEAFGEYMTRHAVDVLKIVPSHLDALMSGRSPAALLPQRLLVVGGEPCSWALVERVRTLAPDVVVINEYGPTETTVGVISQSVQDYCAETVLDEPPIGRPIAGVRAMILDDAGRPVPKWIPGELHVGGTSVARGYLHDPDATASRFLDDPFDPVPGSKLYRTGDLARELGSGELEFLGREDAQVKIHGFRVELTEIERTLKKHEDVEDAVVLMSDGGRDAQLVAYVVPRAGRSPEPEALGGYLRTWLPEYMVPSSIVPLAFLPLTPNGKIDRAELVKRAVAPRAAPSADEAPMSDWERVVADVWGRLLDTTAVGANDNFYDLGGHSLLAIQVVAEIEKRTGVSVSPRELVFNTLRAFATMCESKGASSRDDEEST